jgi:single-strand DNA-binding protein
MPSFNSFSLLGNLTADPEIRYSPGGAPYCTFSVAVNSRRRNAENQLVDRVDFFRVTAKFKLATVCHKYLKKGSLVFVGGELESWRKDEKFGVNFLATNVQFLSGKASAAEAQGWDAESNVWRDEFVGDGAGAPLPAAAHGDSV